MNPTVNTVIFLSQLWVHTKMTIHDEIKMSQWTRHNQYKWISNQNTIQKHDQYWYHNTGMTAAKHNTEAWNESNDKYSIDSIHQKSIMGGICLPQFWVENNL